MLFKKISHFQLEMPPNQVWYFLETTFYCFYFHASVQSLYFYKASVLGNSSTLSTDYTSSPVSPKSQLFYPIQHLVYRCQNQKCLRHRSRIKPSSFQDKHEPLLFCDYLYNLFLFCITFKGLTTLLDYAQFNCSECFGVQIQQKGRKEEISVAH